MTKINQIQNAILSLDAGAYQKMMDEYLIRKFSFENITPLGSHTGTNKTTKGTPDSHVQCDNGQFILIAYGTVSNHSFKKVEADILGCLNHEKTGIQIADILKIICCHTSTNFTPGQVKRLCSHFPETTLVGIGDVSFDLALRYPNIAKDHLSIEIDTHQILDKDEFLRVTSQNAYSTSLDMPLLCREDELSELNDLLHENRVVLMFGGSGIGKTRLALETAAQFSDTAKFIFKIVRVNGESIYDDLKSTFTDDANYLVLVDDADHLVQLQHLLDMCVDDSRHYQIRLLLTVRDYAKEKLIRTVRSVVTPAMFEVKELSDENVSKILSENLNIADKSLIRHIQYLAKGNVRLAVMAGTCVTEGQMSKLQNAFDIFNDYYAPITESLSKDELIVATLIAFFDAFELKEQELPFGLALQQGIDTIRFRDICHILYKNEVVDIHENQAVKFSNQNLRDYLLYLVFFKEKWLRPSEIILCAFPQYKNRLVFAFNTLVRLFNTKENVAYIEKEIQLAWETIGRNSGDIALSFIQSFHIVIPDIALSYVKHNADLLPRFQNNLLEFDFEKNSNNHFIDSILIEILINFKYTDRFNVAIELALYIFEKNTCSPMDMYFLFGERWGIDMDSNKHRYSQEIVLLKTLLCKYEDNKSVLSGFCLLFAATYALKFGFTSHESNRGNSVTFYQFGIVSCGELFELRTLAFRALHTLYENITLRPHVLKSLRSYRIYVTQKSDAEIFQHDMQALATSFGTSLDSSVFEMCRVIDNFQKISNRLHVPFTDSLPNCSDNNIYRIYQQLENEYLLEYESYEQAETARVQAINQLATNCTTEEFCSLCKELQSEQNSKNNLYKIGEGIGILFKFLAKTDPEKFIEWCGVYIKHEIPHCQNFKYLTDNLVSVLGVRSAMEYVKEHHSINQLRLLSCLFDYLPADLLNDEDCETMLALLQDAPDGKHYVVTLESVLRVDSIHEGYFIKYVTALYLISETKSHLLCQFLDQFDLRYQAGAEKLVSYFDGRLELLCNCYIRSTQGRRHFDYHGTLFTCIISKDLSFLSRFIRELFESRIHVNSMSALDELWEQNDYLKLVTTAAETIREIQNNYYFPNTLGEQLFTVEQADSEKCMRQNIWLKQYILKYANDPNRMKFLFEIICNFSEEQRIDMILYFCEQNSVYEDFCNISITPSHLSWTGSEVPLIEKKINFFEHLKNALTGINYIEHREYLATWIQHERKRKDEVISKEFVDERYH